MDKIDIKDVKKLDLKTISINPDTGGRICIYKNKVYKFYGSMGYIREILLKERLRILSSIDMEVLVSPREMIIEKNLFSNILKGISMDRVEDAISLYDLSKDMRYIVDYFYSLVNASVWLYKVHNRKENIILSDANFTNILIKKDSNGNYRVPKFIDVDSASVGRIPTPQKSYLGALYYQVSSKRYYTSQNNDRLVYMIYFLQSIFNKIIFDISEYDFDKMSEYIRSLKNIRDLFIRLKTCNILEIPYLYEFLNPIDAYVFKKKMNF